MRATNWLYLLHLESLRGYIAGGAFNSERKLHLFVSHLLLFTSFGLFTISHADIFNAYFESTKL